jgi:hypothetical protein
MGSFLQLKSEKLQNIHYGFIDFGNTLVKTIVSDLRKIFTVAQLLVTLSMMPWIS